MDEKTLLITNKLFSMALSLFDQYKINPVEGVVILGAVKGRFSDYALQSLASDLYDLRSLRAEEEHDAAAAPDSCENV